MSIAPYGRNFRGAEDEEEQHVGILTYFREGLKCTNNLPASRDTFNGNGGVNSVLIGTK